MLYMYYMLIKNLNYYIKLCCNKLRNEFKWLTCESLNSAWISLILLNFNYIPILAISILNNNIYAQNK